MELEQKQEQQDSYYNFINSLRTDASKHNYRYSLKRFLKYCNLQEAQQLVAFPLRELENMIIKYLVHLNKLNPKSNGMACLDMAAIHHFCKMNKLRLDWEYISEFKGRTQTKKRKKSGKDGAYKHEQIKRILELCDIRYKVIVLLMVSSGVRVGAISSLQLKHLEI